MHMWIFSGVLAIITAFMNVSWTAEGKESKWLMFASLSFTALTLCSFYQSDANWELFRTAFVDGWAQCYQNVNN